MMIDSFSEPQRKMLRHMREIGVVPWGQGHASASFAALESRGIVECRTSQWQHGQLTDVGVAVFEEDALRGQKVTDFKVGDVVERSNFNYSPHTDKYTHTWEQATVRKLGKSRLMLDYADGRKGSCEPWYARKLKESPIMTDAPAPPLDAPAAPNVPVFLRFADQIVADAGTQVRVELNQATVDQYAADMLDGDVFPPLDVTQIGDRRVLTDGFTRRAAAIQIGREGFLCIITPGDPSTALWEGAGGNRHNGLPLSNADKRRAVDLILADPTLRQKSDRAIARQVGYKSSAPVGQMRAQWAAAHPAEAAALGDTRVDDNGRALHTSGIGQQARIDPAVRSVAGFNVGGKAITRLGNVVTILGFDTDGKNAKTVGSGANAALTWNAVEKLKPAPIVEDTPVAAQPKDEEINRRGEHIIRNAEGDVIGVTKPGFPVFHVGDEVRSTGPQPLTGKVVRIIDNGAVNVENKDGFGWMGGVETMDLIRAAAASPYTPAVSDRVIVPGGRKAIVTLIDASDETVKVAYPGGHGSEWFDADQLTPAPAEEPPSEGATINGVPEPQLPYTLAAGATDESGAPYILKLGDRVVTRTGHTGEILAINGAHATVRFGEGATAYRTQHKLTDLTAADSAPADAPPAAIDPRPLAVGDRVRSTGEHAVEGTIHTISANRAIVQLDNGEHAVRLMGDLQRVDAAPTVQIEQSTQPAENSSALTAEEALAAYNIRPDQMAAHMTYFAELVAAHSRAQWKADDAPTPAPARPGVFADLAPLPWTLKGDKIVDANREHVAEFWGGLESVAAEVVQLVNGVSAPALPADVQADLKTVLHVMEELVENDQTPGVFADHERAAAIRLLVHFDPQPAPARESI